LGERERERGRENEKKKERKRERETERERERETYRWVVEILKSQLETHVTTENDGIPHF